MTAQDRAQQPIGYWLNRTDQAITTSMNRILAQYDITRVGWQMLNVLRTAETVAEAQAYATMQANADAATLSATIEELTAKGWIRRTEQRNDLALTEQGHATLEQIRQRIVEFRQQSLQGISADEYQTVITVLERIIQNVSS